MATRRRRSKSIDLPGWLIFLAVVAAGGSWVNSWASGSWVRWVAAGFGAWIVLFWMPYRFIAWSVRRGVKHSARTGVRSRKRLRFGPFVLNLAGRFLPLPSSVGLDIGPYSINSRTKKHRIDLPGPWWWESQKAAKARAAQTYREQMEARPGAVPHTPRKKWEPAGHALAWNGELERDEFGPFPLDRTEHCGYEILRMPKPGKRKSYRFILEGETVFDSLRDALEAAEGMSDQQAVIDFAERKQARQ